MQNQSNNEVIRYSLETALLDPVRFISFSRILMIQTYLLFFFFRSALLRKCWRQDPTQRPKPSEVVRILLDEPELVQACIDVPGTTLLDNSMGNFDATAATARVRVGIGSPQSNHSFRCDDDHVSSTMTLTPKEPRNHVIRKHSVKPNATRTKRHPAMLWRKTSVHF